jgi:hypothetical protein
VLDFVRIVFAYRHLLFVVQLAHMSFHPDPQSIQGYFSWLHMGFRTGLPGQAHASSQAADHNSAACVVKILYFI